MKTTIIKNNNDFSEENINRTDFSKLLSLNIRNLRPVFSILQVSTILPRTNAVIINLGFIKAILTEKTAYFLHQNNSESLEAFLEKLKEQLKSTKRENFYLFILEKILDAKAKQMNKKISLIEDSLQKLLNSIQKNFSNHNLETMLFLKKRISKMETRLNEIHSAAKEVLEDEQNFLDLISLGQVKKFDRTETESILENFIEQIEDSMGHIFRAKEELDDTDQYINLKLSSQRTTVVRIDLIATLFALIFSFLAVLVGLYGVNLKNGFENSNIAFYILSFILIIIFIIMSGAFIIFLKKRKIL
jgi:magnesium transporter